MSNELDDEYAKLFKPIFDDLNTFGIDTITPIQKLKVVALLEAGKVLEGNTRLYYETDEDDYLLPENHNGLGYTKLMQVKDLSEFRHTILSDADETLQFLKQYMVLYRCDIFFADKVVLVEGAVERLLLSEMMDWSAPTLRNQYISVVEVGGAYAIKFKALIDFIGIQTLVISDIDSVDPADNRKACPVAEPGAVTSNVALKNWLPKEDSISNLLALSAVSKSDGLVRVAYQIPEEPGGATGRSFEEAFIIKNAKLLADQADSLALARVFKGI